MNNFFQKIGVTLSHFDLHIRLLLIPLILIGTSGILFLFHLNILHQTNLVQTKPVPIVFFPSLYPQLTQSEEPYLTAQTAIIFNVDSGVAMYKKNPQFNFSMASTTKVMTALVAVDYFKANDTLTVHRSTVEGTVLRFYPGEQFYFDDLLYAMFLPSANDAAYTVADNYPGGKDAFVNAMNAKAKALGLLHTQYTDPAGLEDDGDFTNVIDLSHLAAQLLKNPTLSRVVATKYKFISSVDGVNGYQLENLNKLLGDDGVVGIKTGTTEGAGQVLITAKKDAGHTYVIVVMKSTDRYADTQRLLRLIDTDLQFIAPEQLVMVVKR